MSESEYKKAGIVVANYNMLLFEKQLFDYDFEEVTTQKYCDGYSIVVVKCKAYEFDYVIQMLEDMHKEFQLRKN